MTKTEENKRSIIKLVRLSKKFNENIGEYVEHYINQDFNYSVRLNNNTGVKVSRILAQDYDKMPNILTEEDLERIANSLWEI
tara:strand:+ start:610 stop:855 length:246 start_codon:yes stop_codon:yes gene_type:complete